MDVDPTVSRHEIGTLIGAFNQEKGLEGAFSVITNLRMELFEALIVMLHSSSDVLVSASSHPRGILNMETLLPGASTEYRRSSIEADTESSKMVM